LHDRTQIVGAYSSQEQDRGLGFLLEGTTYTTIDFPGAGDSVGVFDINDREQIVGIYTTPGEDGK